MSSSGTILLIYMSAYSSVSEEYCRLCVSSSGTILLIYMSTYSDQPQSQPANYLYASYKHKWRQQTSNQALQCTSTEGLQQHVLQPYLRTYCNRERIDQSTRSEQSSCVLIVLPQEEQTQVPDWCSYRHSSWEIIAVFRTHATRLCFSLLKMFEYTINMR